MIFQCDATKHIGPIYFWKIYDRFGKWDDKDEIGIGIGIGKKLYFYVGFAVYNGFITLTFRLSGVGKISDRERNFK